MKNRALTITQYLIIRTGHRGDCPLVIVAWWDLPHHLPAELEDTLLYNSQNTSFQLTPLIICLDEFFLLNQEPIHDLEAQLPPYQPPPTSFLPALTFPHPPPRSCQGHCPVSAFLYHRDRSSRWLTGVTGSVPAHQGKR